jgi:CRP/FNR family transcriptional regulator
LLQLSVALPDGREQIVGLAHPGDLVGRPFGRAAGETVAALAESELCVFPRGAFERTAREQPRLEHDLLERALADLDRARGQMLLLARKTATERVASLLIEFDRRNGGDGQIDLPVSRRQIADILGLTIETVSRQLTRLKRQGAIGLSGRRGFSIHSRPALEAAAGA